MASITFCLARVNLLKRNIIFAHCNWYMPHFLQLNNCYLYFIGENALSIKTQLLNLPLHWKYEWPRLSFEFQLFVLNHSLWINWTKLTELETPAWRKPHINQPELHIFGFRNKNTNTQMLYFFSCWRPTMDSLSSINANLINKSVKVGKSVLNDQLHTLHTRDFSNIDSKKKIKSK